MEDNEQLDRKFYKELHGGITALILLGVLDKTSEPMYGYQIAKLIGDEREDSTLKQGVLYPVLRSLESGGMLSSIVEPSVSGPPRRYYQITPVGHSTLGRWQGIWKQTKNFVDTILEGNGHD